MSTHNIGFYGKLKKIIHYWSSNTHLIIFSVFYLQSTTLKNPYNLAQDYGELYPVMFNIILWMMILMAIAFFAVCYGIWNMDPGRDSIIYRMTTTRLKKD